MNGTHSEVNGSATYNSHSPLNVGEASTSYSNGVVVPPQSVFQTHNEEIVNHLYAGFQTGNYSDTLLHVRGDAYRLHAIILARSPLLAHLMSTSGYSQTPGGLRTISLNLDQYPEITQEGFAIALGYLYSSAAVSTVHPSNSRAVLAASCLLGGMDELSHYAYETCRTTILMDSIDPWLDFISSTTSNSDGSIYGPYYQKLREDVFNFLTVTLPEVLTVKKPTTACSDAPDSPRSDGKDLLLRIFSRLPFELFKAAVESPAFQIGTDQQRFKFAKEAIEARKGTFNKGSAEENVVLAFGSSSGGAVHITRKTRKKALWKVNS